VSPSIAEEIELAVIGNASNEDEILDYVASVIEEGANDRRTVRVCVNII